MAHVSIKFSVLASGSKGNSTYLETKDTKILIDLGTTSKYVENALKDLNVNPSELDGIFLTHTHVDHVSGLKVFLKKYHTTLFLSQKMYEDLISLFPISNYVILEDLEYTLKDLKVNIFKTSHDVSDSNGYIFTCDKESVVHITDTGYINRKNFEKLKDHTYYIMESNHDIELLMNGPYPYYLKQRILGDRGHLSNKDSSNYLSKFIGEHTKGIILIHLSHENNDPEVALKTLEDTLLKHHQKVDKILVSKQEERTELIEV